MATSFHISDWNECLGIYSAGQRAIGQVCVPPKINDLVTLLKDCVAHFLGCQNGATSNILSWWINDI